jgi:hypothetical protein
MRQYIKKLQSKSEDTRKIIFTGTMIVSMSIVGLVWFYSLGTRFDSSMKTKVNEDIKPFKLFSDSISSTFKDTTASVGKIPETSVTENRVEEKQIDLIPVEDTNNTNTQ